MINNNNKSIRKYLSYVYTKVKLKC